MTFNFQSELERQRYVEQSFSNLIDFLNNIEPALRYDKEKQIHNDLVNVLIKYDMVTIAAELPSNVISIQEYLKNKHTH